jgi:hypothetical protein
MKKSTFDFISKDYDIESGNEPQFTLSDIQYLMREYAEYHIKECLNEVCNTKLINKLNISEEIKREIKQSYSINLI